MSRTYPSEQDVQMACDLHSGLATAFVYPAINDCSALGLTYLENDIFDKHMTILMIDDSQRAKDTLNFISMAYTLVGQPLDIVKDRVWDHILAPFQPFTSIQRDKLIPLIDDVLMTNRTRKTREVQRILSE